MKIRVNITVCIFCIILQACGWSETKTNLEVLEEQYYSLFSGLLSAHCFADSQCVVEQLKNDTEYLWLINSQLYRCLKEAGVRHIFAEKQSDQTIRVSYKSIAQTITYQQISKKQLKRNIDIQILLQITDASNNMAAHEVVKKNYEDIVAKNRVHALENRNFPFTIGTQKRSWLFAIYEPAIVTSITGMIIYLFYSYRSQ